MHLYIQLAQLLKSTEPLYIRHKGGKAFGNYMSDHRRGIFQIILLILPLVRHSRHSWVYSLTYNFSKLNEETENTIRVIDAQTGCGQPMYFVKCSLVALKID